jgi:hypothetical protein
MIERGALQQPALGQSPAAPGDDLPDLDAVIWQIRERRRRRQNSRQLKPGTERPA